MSFMWLTEFQVKVVVTFIFFAVLLAFFLYNITYFSGYVFDESYYADAALQIYEKGEDPNFQHPPLAKWLISLPFNFSYPNWSLTWRLMPLVFGFMGLIVFYFFSRSVGLSWKLGLLSVLFLVGTKSWYTLSRIAMLDIFVCVFILISAYVLFLYLKRNSFSKKYDEYRGSWILFFVGVWTGLAGLTKWTGFFPFIFYVVLYLMYFEGVGRKRFFHLLFLILVSACTYFLGFLILMGGDHIEVVLRNFRQINFHNYDMLPENNEKALGNEMLKGGFPAFIQFFTSYQIYFVNSGVEVNYGLSNNHFMYVYFAVFALLFVLSVLALVVRSIQKIPMDEAPVFLKEPAMLFLFFYAASLVMPWAFFPRVQYNFYYVPAFPFIILLSMFYVFKYASARIQLLFVLSYFMFFFWGFEYLIPIDWSLF